MRVYGVGQDPGADPIKEKNDTADLQKRTGYVCTRTSEDQNELQNRFVSGEVIEFAFLELVL